jgi:rod shape-determining protein MreC
MAIARRTSRRRYVLLVIVLTAVTLITLDTRGGRSGPLGALGRAAHTIVSPIQGAVESVTTPISDWWHGVTDAGDLKQQNRSLRERLAAAEAKDRAAQRAIDENEDLKRLLGLNSLLNVKRANARIVARDTGNFDSSLTIDHGTESGIVRDMPVVAPNGYLVGSVIDVGRNFAKVRVLTDPVFAVGVRTPRHPGADAATGTASGSVGSRELLVEDFDPQAKIVPGDQIVTSPLSTKFPPDLLVGSVTKVVDVPGGFRRNVFIKPYVDLGALENVAVLLWVQGQGPVVVPRTTTTTSTTTTTTTVPAGATSTSTSVGP